MSLKVNSYEDEERFGQTREFTKLGIFGLENRKEG